MFSVSVRNFLRHLGNLVAIASLIAVFGIAPASAGVTLLSSRSTNVFVKERDCLSTAVYFEARGEPEEGQIAVAQVVLNRVASTHYPDNVCDVVYQNHNRRNRCQFSFACDGHSDKPKNHRAWRKAKRVATDVLAERKSIREIKTATHYHAEYVTPYWAPKMKRLKMIGRHVFFEEI